MLGATPRRGCAPFPPLSGRVAATTLTTVDGIRLAAHTHCVAAPRGSVVVAHGFTASATHADVEALAGALGAAGYDVVTYDARGHGDSEGQCTLGDLERHDVAAAVQATNPASGPVVLVGVSMGAIAVLRHAAEQSESGVRPARRGGHGERAGALEAPPQRTRGAERRHHVHTTRPRVRGPPVGRAPGLGAAAARAADRPGRRDSTSPSPSSTASTTRSCRAATPGRSTTRRRSPAGSTSCRARGMRTTTPRCR